MLVRRLAALGGGILITLGMYLEDRVQQVRPTSPDTDSCLRCRGHIVVSDNQLRVLLERAGCGDSHPDLLVFEAGLLERVDD